MTDKKLPVYGTSPSSGGKKLPSYDAKGNVVQPKSGWISDVLKTIPSALAKGVIGLPGIPGDVNSLIDGAVDWASHKAGAGYRYATDQAPDWNTADAQQTKHEGDVQNALASAQAKAGPVTRALSTVANIRPPTSSTLVDAANSVLGHATNLITGTPRHFYEPQTKPGRITQDIVSSLPAAAIMGPEKMLANLGKNGIGAATSGLGSGMAREAVDPNSPYAGVVQVAGGLAGGLASMGPASIRSLRNPENVAERAKRLAGQTIRESSLDPVADAATIANHLSNPAPVLRGVKPTTAQVLRTPESKALENSVSGITSKDGIPDFSEPQERYSKGVLASGQADSGGQNIPNLIGSGIQKPDMTAALGIAPDMQLTASRALHNHVNDIHNAMKSAENGAWDKVDKNASMDGPHILKDLNNHISSLPIADQKSIPDKISSTISDLTDQYGGSRYTTPMPVSQMQSLRRVTGSMARAAKRAGNDSDAYTLNGLSTRMAGHLNNPDNFLFGDAGGAQAWRDAVNATKARHDAFGNDALSGIADTDLQGNPSIAPEAAIDKIMSGRNAPENVRALKALPGVDPGTVDQSMSDWMMGKLTKNGSNPDLKAQDVARFAADPKNSAVMNEIPSAKSRIGDAAVAASQNDEASRLGSVVDAFHGAFNKGPKNLSDFLADNKDDVLSATDPANHPFIDELQNSADLLKDVKPGGVANSQTLDALKNGSLISYLYGKASGALANVGAVAATGEAAHGALSTLGLHGMAGTMAPIALAARHGFGAIEKGLSDTLLGGTRDDALKLLSQAAADPELAQSLMAQPSPHDFGPGQAIAKGAGKLAAYAAVRPEDKPDVPGPALAPMDFSTDPDVPMDAMDEEEPAVPDDTPPVATGPVEKPQPTATKMDDGRWRLDQADPDVVDPTPRATGGKVMEIDHLVDRLMARAKMEKKGASKDTERFLKLPDAVVAKALAVTQRGI